LLAETQSKSPPVNAKSWASKGFAAATLLTARKPPVTRNYGSIYFRRGNSTMVNSWRDRMGGIGRLGVAKVWNLSQPNKATSQCILIKNKLQRTKTINCINIQLKFQKKKGPAGL